MRKLRMIRIVLAAFFALAVTACFVDPTGTAARWLGWTAKVQFWPAVLATGVTGVVLAAVTLVVGRVYCSVVCPLGILQDVAASVRQAFGRPFRPPAVPRRRVSFSACFRIAVAVVFFVGGFLGLRFVWLEPYAIYGRAAASVQGDLPIWFRAVSLATVAAIGALAVWKGRVWCNTVCPVGAFLGFLALLTRRGPQFKKDLCVSCRRCERACRARCLDAGAKTVDRTKCVGCFTCGAVCTKGALTWSK